tara:strand:+ start:205 stop:312 length:108 start_codon:yes stop_codon:yes gene_type:complete
MIEELEDIKWQSYQEGDIISALAIQVAIDEIMINV